MTVAHTPLIVIPARMASTRLPDKPLAMIAGAPMIVQVLRRARESGLGDVIVACDGEAIAHEIRREGSPAIVTDPGLPSGSDRVWKAVEAYDPFAMHDIIINLQGDLPTLDPSLLTQLLPPFADPAIDIVTLAAPITDEAEKGAESVVKPLLVASRQSPVASQNIYEAVDFVRGRAPEEPMYHHIGVYAYRREALKRFVGLKPSKRETERKLEQMRALDAGMRIACVLVDTVPLGVDTPEDLEKAREVLVR